MGEIIQKAKDFKRRYPMTLSFRTTLHAKLLEHYVNPDEKVLYVFVGQKNNSFFDIFSSCAVVLTTDRILIAQKRVVFGHFYSVITPDMFNDLKVVSGLIWSTIIIDTVKEIVHISHLDNAATDEIETAITKYMIEEKKKYGRNGGRTHHYMEKSNEPK